MKRRRTTDRTETAGGASAPLVVLGQGEYAREYPRPLPDLRARGVLMRNAAVLQSRAGGVISRAGLFGFMLQHHGATSAARELRELGKAVDDLVAAMAVVAEQLDAVADDENGGGS